MKKSFLIYVDIADALFSTMSDEQLGRFLRMCVNYTKGVSEDVVALQVGNDAALGVAWALYKTTLDRDAERYNAKCEKLRANVQKRWDKYKGVQTDTEEYNCIQMYSNRTDNVNVNDNVKVKESDKSLYAHTREELKKLLTGENYTAWREALAMTHRSLTAEQIVEAITRAVDWCAAEGKPLDEATVKHYANKECAMLAARPGRGRSLDDRREAFRRECEALRGISNDGELVAQFFAYYSQPTQAGDALRFETFDAWDTATRFRLYLKSVNNGKY